MVPLVDVECPKKCKAMVKVGLSRFLKPIVELLNPKLLTLKSTNLNPKKLKNPTNKNSFLHVLQRLKSDL